MATTSCSCGAHLSDDGDNLPNKAYVLRDQDFDAFWEEVRKRLGSVPAQPAARIAKALATIQRKYFLVALECPQCSRLHIQDGIGSKVFSFYGGEYVTKRPLFAVKTPRP